MTIKKLASKLGAEISNGWLNMRGPGHSKGDRSLGIRLDPAAPDGFWVHSFADDPEVCRKHVLKLLTKVASGQAINIELEEASSNDAEQEKRIAAALLIWQEAKA
jgi:hypothetical protein